MVTYKYIARTSSGERVSGLIEAYDRLDAADRIRSGYGTVLSLKELHRFNPEMPGILNMEVGGSRLDPKAFTLMCNQFATILTAGIPIARAVKLIADKTADKPLHRMLLSVAADVEAGRTISSSFEEHGADILPPTFVETLRAGEEAGDLSGSFDSIYRHYDKQTKMNDKVRTAMLYPLFVLVIAIVVVIVLMVKVVPTFTSIFEELNTSMPLMTRILIAVSGFISHTYIYFLLGIALLGLAVLLFRRTERGKLKLAQIELSLPVLGNIAELNAASLFANTMATMIGSGLPMTKSVAITASVMPNYLIRTKVSSMVARIEEGRTVVDSLRESGSMPDILTDMVGVGEETGEMKSTLDTVAAYYDSELELAITRAVTMLEPALLCFVAVIAGFIVVAIYLSMFEMYGNM